MRLLPVLLALLPTIGFSEDIILSGKVTDVTLYPQGATIERNISFQAEAGQHELIVTGLPVASFDAVPRVSLKGADLGLIVIRQDYVPARDDATNAALETARALVKSIEADILAQRDKIKATRLENEAVTARIKFLRQIGEGDKLANADLEMLRNLARMIGEETLAARQDGHKAELAARSLETVLDALKEDLETAQKNLAALVPEDIDYGYLSVSISSEVAIDGVLSISNMDWQAAWAPTYDMRLTTEETPALVIERAAMIRQETGENWQGVNLTLSTLRPTEQLQPSEIYERRRRIEQPAPPEPMLRSMEKTAMMMEPTVVIEEAASMAVDYDGLSVSYSYSAPIDMASGADVLRIVLGELKTSASVHAGAVPLSDDTAFLMAEITNDMGEPILPSEESGFFLNGLFIGEQPIFEMIPTGAKATLSFGPIEGLRLTRKIINRNEGDSGFVSRVNETLELAEIKVENLTDRAWDVRLLDRVPFSEQEDLVISWRAKPKPSKVDLDGRRGILRWDFTLAPKADQMITLSTEIEWPTGMELH